MFDSSHPISFYRGAKPLWDLKKKGLLDFDIPQVIDWSTLMGTDIVFIQAGYTDKHVQVANIASMMGKKIILDYDDIYSDLPSDNPVMTEASKLGVTANDIKENIKTIMSLADKIIVSTQYLKDTWVKAGYSDEKKIVVLRNSLDDDYQNINNAKFSDYNKVCLWRGSHYHVHDLEKYKTFFLDLAKENPDFKFVFKGINIFGKQRPSNVVYQDMDDLLMYMKWIQALKPSICFSPLRTDLPINLAKSDLSKLEYTQAGGITLHEALPEFNWGNCLKIESAQFFINKVREKSPMIKGLWQENIAQMLPERTSGSTNAVRYEIFRSVLNV
jgi:hypothetical protein